MKKIHASDLFKMREDIFYKKHTYTADNLGKKCKHKKFTPPPPPPNRPLDDTSTTQAVLRPEKSQERRANFPRGGPGMVELRNILKIEVEKGLNSILHPPLSQN